MSAPTSEIPTALDPDLEAGQLIGEYQVESKLGQGGFGTVFKAVHPLIGKVVAIKVLARKFSVDPEMVSRFIAEARAVNQIRSRHIIDIFSFGQLEDGRHYYVMEYLEGEPLDATIERGPIPLAEALPTLRAIAKALDAAHAKGIAHRDLNPENIYLFKDDSGDVWPKLLDFGIAKLMGSDDGQKHKTRTGIPIGTPYYMSPEQCRGKDVDHRTDYYAFGVVAYQMLTGVRPIDADDYMSIMMRQISTEPAAPSTLIAELPSGVDDAIAWLMKKDPADRPPNLMTAMRALEQVAEASGIAIPRMTSALQTPTPGSLPRAPTPQSPRSITAPAPASGLAMTMPSSAAVEAPRRSRVPLVAVLGAAIAVVVVIVVMMRGGSNAPVAPAVPPIQHPAAATAPAVAPAPVDAAMPPDAAVAMIIVDVTGVPDGTEVSIAGKPVGAAPGPVQLPRGTSLAVLTFTADGYLPASKSLTPDRDQPLAIQLKRRGHAATRATNNKDDIIDVFGKKP